MRSLFFLLAIALGALMLAGGLASLRDGEWVMALFCIVLGGGTTWVSIRMLFHRRGRKRGDDDLNVDWDMDFDDWDSWD